MSAEEFVMFLAMPEEHLGWRGHFARRKDETDEELEARRTLWNENRQYIAEWTRRFQALGEGKDRFIKYIGDNNHSIERFLEIEDVEHKKLFIHYFTVPTLLKAFKMESSDGKEVIAEYITKDFPLMYKRLVKYVTEVKLPYSMLEGVLRTFGAGFARDVLEQIDYTAEEEPFIIGNLIKAQKKAQLKVFEFELVRSFFLYRNSGALRKRDISESIGAIKDLDNGKLRRILAARFEAFREKLIEQATAGAVGAEYVAAQIEQQLNGFCKQISLFEDL